MYIMRDAYSLADLTGMYNFGLVAASYSVAEAVLKGKLSTPEKQP